MPNSYDSRRTGNIFLSLSNGYNRNEPPRRSPGTYYLNRDFDKWSDRIFLMFIRDRLLWLHNVRESDPMIVKLNDIIHCSCPDWNSTMDL